VALAKNTLAFATGLVSAWFKTRPVIVTCPYPAPGVKKTSSAKQVNIKDLSISLQFYHRKNMVLNIRCNKLTKQPFH
jgi:hypothetical protein